MKLKVNFNQLCVI